MMRVLFPLLLLTLIGLPAMPEPQSASGKKRARLYVMGSESLFTAVNRNGATASLRVWIDALGKRRGFEFDTRLEVFQSVDEVIPRLKDNSVDMLVLDTPDYLILSESRLVEPVAVGTKRGEVGAYPYLLLVRDVPGVTALSDLRGKRVVVNSRTKAGMGVAWLETLLADNRMPGAAQFFASVTETYKPSSCVLPLLFGQIETCVVDLGNYELLKELNPQLARLKVLARSEPFVEGLVAMPVSPHPYKNELIASIMELHQDPAGAQMVLLFKSGPLIPAATGQFESARAIWNKYLRLKGGPARLGAAGPPSVNTAWAWSGPLAFGPMDEQERKVFR